MRAKDSYPVPVQLINDGTWGQLFLENHNYDRLEVWGDRSISGYYWQYKSRREATIDAVLAHCPRPARLLDIAGAAGNFSISLAGLGYQVTWNDLRAELIDYVRLKCSNDTSLAFKPGNVFEMSEAESSFDVVLATEVIEHVAHPDEFLVKAAKLLTPGGHIVISTPNGGYFRNGLPRFSDCPDPAVFEAIQFAPNSDGHIFLLYEDEIRRLAAEAGLVVRQLDLITNPLTAGYMKLHKLHRILPDGAIIGMENLSRRLPNRLRAALCAQTIAVLQKPK